MNGALHFSPWSFASWSLGQNYDPDSNFNARNSSFQSENIDNHKKTKQKSAAKTNNSTVPCPERTRMPSPSRSPTTREWRPILKRNHERLTQLNFFVKACPLKFQVSHIYNYNELSSRAQLTYVKCNTVDTKATCCKLTQRAYDVETTSKFGWK